MGTNYYFNFTDETKTRVINSLKEKKYYILFSDRLNDKCHIGKRKSKGPGETEFIFKSNKQFYIDDVESFMFFMNDFKDDIVIFNDLNVAMTLEVFLDEAGINGLNKHSFVDYEFC